VVLHLLVVDLVHLPRQWQQQQCESEQDGESVQMLQAEEQVLLPVSVSG
jgi:hypothetical protein